MKTVIIDYEGVKFLTCTIAQDVATFIKEKFGTDQFYGSCGNYLTLIAILFEKYHDLEKAKSEARRLLWEGDLLGDIEHEECSEVVEPFLEELIKNDILNETLLEIVKFIKELIKELLDVKSYEEAVILATYLATQEKIESSKSINL